MSSAESPDDVVVFVVESILDKKFVKKKGAKPVALYLIHWAGYPASDDSWEPAQHLGGCKDMLQTFEIAHAQKVKVEEERLAVKRKVPAHVDKTNKRLSLANNTVTPSNIRKRQSNSNDENKDLVKENDVETSPMYQANSSKVNSDQDEEYNVPQLIKLMTRIKAQGGKVTKTKNIQRMNPSHTRFKVEFMDKSFSWESLQTIKELNILPHITKFIKNYIKKKSEKVNDAFISFFEDYLGINLSANDSITLLETPDDLNTIDEEWIRLQDRSIPHYFTWKKMFTNTRKPWPLIENTRDGYGPPMTFKWTDDNITEIKDLNTNHNDFVIGCECSNFAYAECTGVTCSCASEWGLDYAYGNDGLLDPDFDGNIIIECNDKCDCSKTCPNRIIQNGRKLRLVIFRCHDGKGWGVKTLEAIPAGTFIDEYVGEIIRNEEAESRGLADQLRGITYLFDLDAFVAHQDDTTTTYPTHSTYTLDANYYGNVTHFLNHSCVPNISSYAVMINNVDPSMHRLAFFAKRDIQAGEELVFDYAGHYFETVEGQKTVKKSTKGRKQPKKQDIPPNEKSMYFKCLCGERECQGYIRFRD